MVARLLGLVAVPSPDHAADALAVAVCELNRAPLLGALERPVRVPGRAGAGRAGVSEALLARAAAAAGAEAAR